MKAIPKIFRAILIHKFTKPTRCVLAPLCQSDAEYMAEIHYSRFISPSRSKPVPAFMSKPACRHHAKKFAAKFGIPFPVLDATKMCPPGSEPMA